MLFCHLHRRCDHQIVPHQCPPAPAVIQVIRVHMVHSRSVTRKIKTLKLTPYLCRFPTAKDMHSCLLMIAGSTYISQGWGSQAKHSITHWVTGSSRRQRLAGPQGGGKQSPKNVLIMYLVLAFEDLTVLVVVSGVACSPPDHSITPARSTARGPTTGRPARICKV